MRRWTERSDQLHVPVRSANSKSRKLPTHAPNPIYRGVYVAFLKVLGEMREASGLTIRALAERMWRPHMWVHKCETGQRRMDVPEFLEWCKACKVGFAEAARRLEKK